MDLTKKTDIDGWLTRLEEYCSRKDYAGFCKFDALNSPILEKLFGRFMLTRLLATQVVNRIPLPLRQWLGVPRKRNPKGIANFVKGYVARYATTKNPRDKEKAIVLADWLLRNESRELGAYSGPGKAWGYHFPWQSPGFFAPRHSPNCIVTTFVGEAMLSVFEITGKRKYLDAAFGVRDFLLKGLPTLLENDREKCIGYVPVGLRWRVININAVAGGFLSRLAVRTADRELQHTAGKMIQWVVERRNANDTWDYTSPKEQSGIGPDNYHTGGILDGLHDYMVYSGDTRFAAVYSRALDAYQKHFFEKDGAPRWRMDKSYPRDVHGSAQGILTFARAGRLSEKYRAVVATIAHWALANLFSPDEGRFYYQQRRSFTWKIDLMRWNNSWMFRALAEAEQMKEASLRKPDAAILPTASTLA